MTMAMFVRKTRIFAHCMDLERTTWFGGDAVYVHRAVATLCRNIFVQWVPSDTLNKM